jgi:hypothetical protein
VTQNTSTEHSDIIFPRHPVTQLEGQRGMFIATNEVGAVQWVTTYEDGKTLIGFKPDDKEGLVLNVEDISFD